MTFKELQDDVILKLGKEQITANSFYSLDDIKSAINRGQERVALDMKVPRRKAYVDSATPLELPSDAWGHGLISLTTQDESTQLELHTIATADDLFPSWPDIEDDSGPPQFAIYDPGNISAPIVIVPKQSEVRRYYLHYTIKPTPMAADTDEPFSGDRGLVPLHELIAIWAAHMLWDATKTGEAKQEAQYYEQMYYRRRAERGNVGNLGRRKVSSRMRRYFMG